MASILIVLGIFVGIGLVFAAPLAVLPAFVQRGRSSPRFRWTLIVVVALLVTLITHVGYTYLGARVTMIFLSIGSCDNFDSTSSCSLAPPEPEYSQYVRELWLRYGLPPMSSCYSNAQLCEQIDLYVSTGRMQEQDWGQFLIATLFESVAGLSSGALLWWRTRPVRKRKTDP